MIRHDITTADGQVIAVRVLEHAAADSAETTQTKTTQTADTAVLLHATMSSSEQLLTLARRLTSRFRVVLIDRRGSGESVMTRPVPVPVATHAADVVAVLDTLRIDRATVIGHSLGGVIALRVGADHPDRVERLIVWEPPYLAVADPSMRAGMATMADDVAAAFTGAGSEAAVHRFMDAIMGPGAWDGAAAHQREAAARLGVGVLADVSMPGLTTDGLDAITAATTIASGSASEPFYRPIADRLAELIGHASRVDLPDLDHMAPISHPAPIADLILEVAGTSRAQGTAR